MEQVVQAEVAKKVFMGSVLVARGGDIVLSKGYGMANVEWEIPNAPSTKFRLGSITKQFTAASILLLEQRGKLSVEERVKTYLPDVPASWDRITVRNLLTHTGGIPNFTALPAYREMQVSPTSPEKIIAMVKDRPLDFEAGEKMSYSNSGYVVLGAIIEKISGGTYAEFVQKNLFSPLGMSDSGYDSHSIIIPRRAAGYMPGANGPINAGYIDMTVPHAAGALYSTTLDLLKWEQALFAGKVVTPASLEKMTTPFKNNYAYGLTVQTVKGRKVIAHDGGIDGFNTHMAYYPDSKVTVIVLGNLNGRGPAEIGGKLEALAHGDVLEQTADRREITLTPATLQKYVGTYELAPGMNLMVTLEEGKLLAQLTGQGKAPIYAEAEGKFFYRMVDAQLDFTSDPGGKVTSATLHQNGRDITAMRISDSVAPPAARNAITLPIEKLTPLVGTYEMQGGATMTIALDGDHLTTQLTGQPAIRIFAESETKFFLRVVDATLTFEKDAAGKVTDVTLRQGSITNRGRRQ
jgi:CubicO group peptidase (beta-lactamase class C family)